MEEIWKDIVGYEGLYQVSNLGRVRSLDRYVLHKQSVRKLHKGCIMNPYRITGYPAVHLSKDGQKKGFLVHRLVATAFIPNPNNLPEVNHKDESRTNNIVDNLEWCTVLENNVYGTKIERQTAKIRKPVLQYDLSGNFIKEWQSAVAAEREIAGKFTSAIMKCASGTNKTAYGYIWQYK